MGTGLAGPAGGTVDSSVAAVDRTDEVSDGALSWSPGVPWVEIRGMSLSLRSPDDELVGGSVVVACGGGDSHNKTSATNGEKRSHEAAALDSIPKGQKKQKCRLLT